MLAIIGSALAATISAVPFFAPGFIPAFTPTIIPGIVATLPAIVPGLVPTTVPAEFIPYSFTSGAIITGKCVTDCTELDTASAAALGLSNSYVTCVSRNCVPGASGAPAGIHLKKRQGVVVGTGIPIVVCLGATTQALCNTCFTLVRCNNVLGFTAAQLASITGCFCFPTLTSGCTSCDESKKGLLGLLGLLGIIPIVLILCCLLLCCLRRRKRSRDVQFGTFDPACGAVPMPMAHSHCPIPGPQFAAPTYGHGGAPPCF